MAYLFEDHQGLLFTYHTTNRKAYGYNKYSGDVKELIDIVIEDRISRVRTNDYREFANLKQKDLLQWKLEDDLRVSYITEIDRISKCQIE